MMGVCSGSHAVEIVWQSVKKVLTISARDFTVVSTIQEHDGVVYTAGTSVGPIPATHAIRTQVKAVVDCSYLFLVAVFLLFAFSGLLLWHLVAFRWRTSVFFPCWLWTWTST